MYMLIDQNSSSCNNLRQSRLQKRNIIGKKRNTVVTKKRQLAKKAAQLNVPAHLKPSSKIYRQNWQKSREIGKHAILRSEINDFLSIINGTNQQGYRRPQHHYQLN